jgi:hypothetical protein
MYIIKEVRLNRKTKKKIVSFFSYFMEFANVRQPIMTPDIDNAKNFDSIEQAEEIAKAISPQCRVIENPYLIKSIL